MRTIEEILSKEIGKECLSSIFGIEENLNPRSAKEVITTLSQGDKKLFDELISTRTLNKNGIDNCIVTVAYFIQNGLEIPASIKEMLITDAVVRYGCYLALNYLAKYKTNIISFGDLIGTAYSVLSESFEDWQNKDVNYKIRRLSQGKQVYASFATFAFNRMKNAFAEEIIKESKITTNLTAVKKIKNLNIIKSRFCLEKGRYPTPSELYAYCDKYSESEYANFEKNFGYLKDGSFEDTLKEAYKMNTNQVSSTTTSLYKATLEVLKKILTRKELMAYQAVVMNNTKKYVVAEQLDIPVTRFPYFYKKIEEKIQSNKALFEALL